jgi:copper chaperone
MEKKYQLQGMSCGGCMNTVKRALLQVPNVTDVKVHLTPQEAIITMSQTIVVKDLQAELSKSGHYTIKESLLQ